MKKSLVILLMAALILALSINVIVFADGTAGSADNPLVTKSYVDEQIAKLASSQQTSTGSASFTLVEVSAGKTIVGYEGTEMVFRTGTNKASIPSTAGGGISDLTAGGDIANGKAITCNHLLLYPRSDGRGVYCSKSAYVLVKGNYSIQ